MGSELSSGAAAEADCLRRDFSFFEGLPLLPLLFPAALEAFAPSALVLDPFPLLFDLLPLALLLFTSKPKSLARVLQQIVVYISYIIYKGPKQSTLIHGYHQSKNTQQWVTRGIPVAGFQRDSGTAPWIIG